MSEENDLLKCVLVLLRNFWWTILVVIPFFFCLLEHLISILKPKYNWYDSERIILKILWDRCMTFQYVSGVFSTVIKDTDSLFMRIFLHTGNIFLHFCLVKKKTSAEWLMPFLLKGKFSAVYPRLLILLPLGTLHLLQDSDLLALDQDF